METGEKTFDTDIHGEKLYQKRARKALPILVRQAKAEQPIYYSDLAEELNMPNPRNLNYVLGAIGNSLKKLAKEWDEEIPLINVLVINKNDNLPGEGIGYFIKNREPHFENSSKREKRRLLNIYLSEVFKYSKWDKVLKALKLEQSKLPIIRTTPSNKNSWGKGESPEHEKLKIYVSNHPEIVGIHKNLQSTNTEYVFLSQDAADVLFKTKFSWIGIEVKSRISNTDDILRGLFQCVKYKSLIEAEQIINNIKPNADVFLVTEKEFPNELLSIKNLLGINVIDNVKIE